VSDADTHPTALLHLRALRSSHSTDCVIALLICLQHFVVDVPVAAAAVGTARAAVALLLLVRRAALAPHADRQSRARASEQQGHHTMDCARRRSGAACGRRLLQCAAMRIRLTVRSACRCARCLLLFQVSQQEEGQRSQRG